MGAPNWKAVVLAPAEPPKPAPEPIRVPAPQPAPEPVVAKVPKPRRRPLFEPTGEQIAAHKARAAEGRKKASDARKDGVGLPIGQHPCTAEIDYTDAEVEFAVAIERYKRTARRPIPTNREVLKVLLDLGYRKEATPCDSQPLTSLPKTNSGE